MRGQSVSYRNFFGGVLANLLMLLKIKGAQEKKIHHIYNTTNNYTTQNGTMHFSIIITVDATAPSCLPSFFWKIKNNIYIQFIASIEYKAFRCNLKNSYKETTLIPNFT